MAASVSTAWRRLEQVLTAYTHSKASKCYRGGLHRVTVHPGRANGVEQLGKVAAGPCAVPGLVDPVVGVWGRLVYEWLVQRASGVFQSPWRRGHVFSVQPNEAQRVHGMYGNILSGVVVDSVFGVLCSQLEMVGQIALQLLEFVLEFFERRGRMPRCILALLPAVCLAQLPGSWKP